MIQIKSQKIIVGSSDRNIGVVGNNLSKTLQFSVPKSQGAVDLSELSAVALIERSPKNGGECYYAPVVTECVSNNVVVSLPIKSSETMHYGYIYISLMFSSSNLITLMSDYGSTVEGTVKCTCVGHGLVGTVPNVTIEGTSDYDGTYTITVIDDDNFYLTATWVSAQYGWFYISAPVVWQTEKALFTISRNINGEEVAESVAPDIYARQIASLETRCNQLIALFTNYCISAAMGQPTIPLIELPENNTLEVNNSYFGTLGGTYILPTPVTTAIENIIHIYGYCDGTAIDLNANLTANDYTFNFESGHYYEIEYRYCPNILGADAHWSASAMLMG